MSSAARRTRYIACISAVFGAALGLAPAANAQVSPEQVVFDALTRTDYQGNTYSGPGAVDFSGVSTVGDPTQFTKGRTLSGQSFSAQNLGLNSQGQAGFEVTRLQFYLWNGSAADGGLDGVNYNNIRANINFYQSSSGNDELTTTPDAPIFGAQVGTTLSYDFTAQQVTDVNGVNGAATLITVTVPQPMSYTFNRYGDPTDDVNSINNRFRNFLGISISLQGDSGAGFGTNDLNDLSVAIWDQRDYQQTTTGKIAMATRNDGTTGHPYGGFYRDYNVPSGDPLHRFGNFSGLDERSVAGTSFNSLALALYGRNITATPEPGTAALMLPFFAAGGIAWKRRRRTAKKAQTVRSN